MPRSDERDCGDLCALLNSVEFKKLGRGGVLPWILMGGSQPRRGDRGWLWSGLAHAGAGPEAEGLAAVTVFLATFGEGKPVTVFPWFHTDA